MLHINTILFNLQCRGSSMDVIAIVAQGGISQSCPRAAVAPRIAVGKVLLVRLALNPEMVANQLL
jgi:hypothetical protein